MMQRYGAENAAQVPLLYGLANHWADMLGVEYREVNDRLRHDRLRHSWLFSAEEELRLAKREAKRSRAL
jgi:hypothetical protein